jgi:hypothetical protein
MKRSAAAEPQSDEQDMEVPPAKRPRGATTGFFQQATAKRGSPAPPAGAV